MAEARPGRTTAQTARIRNNFFPSLYHYYVDLSASPWKYPANLPHPCMIIVLHCVLPRTDYSTPYSVSTIAGSTSIMFWCLLLSWPQWFKYDPPCHLLILLLSVFQLAACFFFHFFRKNKNQNKNKAYYPNISLPEEEGNASKSWPRRKNHRRPVFRLLWRAKLTLYPRIPTKSNQIRAYTRFDRF